MTNRDVMNQIDWAANERERVAWRIVSRAELPTRMAGTFTFKQAHELTCEWNARNPTERMAFAERVTRKEGKL